MKKVDELFMLKEFDSDDKFKVKFKLSKTFQRLYKKNIASFWNYFRDSNCGFIIIELKEGYYVELYHEINTSSTIDEAFILLGNEAMDQIDPMNIYKILSIDNTINEIKRGNTIHYSVLPFDLIYISDMRINKKGLYFEKKKYSLSECERWANFSLKSWVIFNIYINKKVKPIARDTYFNKRLIRNDFDTTSKKAVNEEIKKKMEKLIISMDSGIRLLDLNGITFTLEAMMLYNQKRGRIQQEYKELVDKLFSLKNNEKNV